MNESPDQLDVSAAHVVAEWEHGRPLVACRFDPSGQYVFCGAEDAAVQRFAAADGTRTSLEGGHETWVRAFAFTADGSHVVSGGSDGRLVWWETAAETPTPVRTVEAHAGWIRALATSPDGKLLASAGNDRIVRLWNLEVGGPVAELAGHEKHVYSLLFARDGEHLLSGDLGGKIHEWTVSDRKLSRSFDAAELHSYNGGQQVDFGGVRALAQSADGSQLVAGGLHKATNPLGAVHEPIVQRFNYADAEKAETQLTDGITGGVLWRLTFLANGVLTGVCGGSTGGFLLFWNAGEEKDFHRLKLPNLARDMDLAPDGVTVATAHHDRKLRISKLAPKEEAA